MQSLVLCRQAFTFFLLGRAIVVSALQALPQPQISNQEPVLSLFHSVHGFDHYSTLNGTTNMDGMDDGMNVNVSAEELSKLTPTDQRELQVFLQNESQKSQVQKCMSALES